jgi:hypothetical protein
MMTADTTPPATPLDTTPPATPLDTATADTAPPATPLDTATADTTPLEEVDHDKNEPGKLLRLLQGVCVENIDVN